MVSQNIFSYDFKRINFKKRICKRIFSHKFYNHIIILHHCYIPKFLQTIRMYSFVTTAIRLQNEKCKLYRATLLKSRNRKYVDVCSVPDNIHKKSRCCGRLSRLISERWLDLVVARYFISSRLKNNSQQRIQRAKFR